MYVIKTRKWFGSNINTHVTFFDRNLVFKLNCFNVAFPLCQGTSVCGKQLQKGLLLVFL